MFSRRSLAAVVAFAASVSAQTFSKCDPLKVDPSTCDPNPAFGGTANIDFTKGGSSLFTASTGTSVTYGANGAEVKIDAEGQAPTFTSTKYMFFGTVDVKLRVSKGQGIITTVVLESDVLDEIDWEWRGSINGMVQANYFSKGDTSSYGKLEQDIAIPGGDDVDTFHTYGIDWNAERLQWLIDGTVYRTLTYAGNEATYPQTPMMVKFGTWCAGCSTAPGTVEWAGGAPDWSQAPFIAYYQSIDIKDTSNGVANAVSYQYTDQTGNMASIKVNTGSDTANNTDTSSDSGNTADTSSDSGNNADTSAAVGSTDGAATGAQSTPTTLSKAPAVPDSTAPATTPAATGQGQAQVAHSGVNATVTRASGAATATGAAATSTIVQAGAQKSAVNFAFLGAVMFAFFCL